MRNKSKTRNRHAEKKQKKQFVELVKLFVRLFDYQQSISRSISGLISTNSYKQQLCPAL